jgi:uncharacterized protein (TIGR02466 family)
VIQGLFPIPLGIYELNRKLTTNEVEFCKNQKFRENTYNQLSVDRRILSDKNLLNVRLFVENSLKKYCKDVYGFRHERNELYITQSWINETLPGEKFHRHWHENSLVSGVFYIDVNENDRIEFVTPNKNSFTHTMMVSAEPNPKELNSYNSTTWWMPTKVGTLYLFPSSLPHGVPLVDGKTKRYSLSFNTFLRGEVGNYEDLTVLKL